MIREIAEKQGLTADKAEQQKRMASVRENIEADDAALEVLDGEDKEVLVPGSRSLRNNH